MFAIRCYLGFCEEFRESQLEELFHTRGYKRNVTLNADTSRYEESGAGLSGLK